MGDRPTRPQGNFQYHFQNSHLDTPFNTCNILVGEVYKQITAEPYACCYLIDQIVVQ